MQAWKDYLTLWLMTFNVESITLEKSEGVRKRRRCSNPWKPSTSASCGLRNTYTQRPKLEREPVGTKWKPVAIWYYSCGLVGILYMNFYIYDTLGRDWCITYIWIQIALSIALFTQIYRHIWHKWSLKQSPCMQIEVACKWITMLQNTPCM